MARFRDRLQQSAATLVTGFSAARALGDHPAARVEPEPIEDCQQYGFCFHLVITCYQRLAITVCGEDGVR